MTEEFLQYAWRYRLVQGEIRTTRGEEVLILKPGDYNRDGGPDFMNARVRIAGTLWVGNVEVHVRSSDWNRHHHEQNPRYDSVILHVVFEDDLPVYRNNLEPIPTIAAKKYLNPALFSVYEELQQARRWVPCENMLGDVHPVLITNMLDRTVVERFRRRSDWILSLLESCNGDWEQVAYVLIARNFGTRVNAQAFEWLARSVPLQLLLRYRDQSLKMEALLFGQAGMLHDHFIDDYPRQLRAEYHFLQKKHGLVPLDGHLWDFLRLRPRNFPTVRIAQLADLFQRQTNLFSRLLEIRNMDDLYDMLDCACSDYWLTHFIFDRISGKKIKRIGSLTVMLVAINTVVPLLFAYGHYTGNQQLKDQAIDLLRQVDGEQNSVIRRWTSLGMDTSDAFRTQGLLELKEYYCDQKRCLECIIGKSVIN
jgi:hypothetical protein